MAKKKRSLKKDWEEIAARYNIFDVPVEDHLQNTGQIELPQADLLVKSLHHMEDQLVEAYLRGSFSLGNADKHSDVDLFVVVEPENLEAAYDSFLDYIKSNYDIVVSCHDRLVADYGGIGFMFVIKDENDNMFQFDLYMAMKGVPPRTFLRSSPRVYVSDPDYCWLAERCRNDLPEQTQKFIDEHTGGSTVRDELRYQMVDLMVALNIMKKHIQRGQDARALGDNTHAISVCVEMLRAIQEDSSVHTSLYAADQMIKDLYKDNCYEGISRNLHKLIHAPVSLDKITYIFEEAMDILRMADPELYVEMKPALNEYERLVLLPIYSGRVPWLPNNEANTPSRIQQELSVKF